MGGADAPPNFLEAPMGYSQKLYDTVAAADMSLLGVQLGAACIDANIPVRIVAAWLDVSRQGVYLWFTGMTDIAEKHRDTVQEIIEILLAALESGDLPAKKLSQALAVIDRYRGMMK